MHDTSCRLSPVRDEILKWFISNILSVESNWLLFPSDCNGKNNCHQQVNAFNGNIELVYYAAGRFEIVDIMMNML